MYYTFILQHMHFFFFFFSLSSLTANLVMLDSHSLNELITTVLET
jgi:hypothetical protein